MRLVQPTLAFLSAMCFAGAASAQTPAATAAQASAASAGRMQFETRCAVCHGGDGNGGEFGPPMVARLATRSNDQLATLVREGRPQGGMPGQQVPDAEMRELINYLRTMRPPAAPGATAAAGGGGGGGGRGGGGGGGGGAATAPPVPYALQGGGTVQGTPINHADADDIQLRTPDGRVQLLRRAGDAFRPVTSQVDWSGYNGSPDGNRYTTMTEIDRTNVRRLAPKWTYTILSSTRLEVTPVVVGGIMYVTNGNEAHALDAGNGREIWSFQRPRTVGLIGNAASGINRGVAIAGDRAFMVTDHAHIIALNRFTGELMWETEMADWRENYNATSAPLIVGNLVISGTAGGEQGTRGFVAAYDQETGREVWRFWTVPKRGEPGSETWIGDDIDHPGGVAWMTGVFDPELNLTYWTTGNPSPDYNGDGRLGDNLWSSSVVALDATTGVMKWHYQFTPHNVWDWDAQQPTPLIDVTWNGQPRKLLIQASRNGFFYVLDRTNGELLLAKQFAENVTWATGIGTDGRPILVPGMEPTNEGKSVCPSSHGAANWYSASYSPQTGLYYVQTLENCNVFVKNENEWAAGRSFLGGTTRQSPEGPNQKILRAIDVKTGNIAWELRQDGPGAARGGTLATATGLVFFVDDTDRFMAVDAQNGTPLWNYPTSVVSRASPMTYQFDGRQYVAVASGPNILVFGLVD